MVAVKLAEQTSTRSLLKHCRQDETLAGKLTAQLASQLRRSAQLPAQHSPILILFHRITALRRMSPARCPMSDGCKSKLPVIPRGNEKSKETVCAVVVEYRRIDLHKNVEPQPTSNAVFWSKTKYSARPMRGLPDSVESREWSVNWVEISKVAVTLFGVIRNNADRT